MHFGKFVSYLEVIPKERFLLCVLRNLNGHLLVNNAYDTMFFMQSFNPYLDIPF